MKQTHANFKQIKETHGNFQQIGADSSAEFINRYGRPSIEADTSAEFINQANSR